MEKLYGFFQLFFSIFKGSHSRLPTAFENKFILICFVYIEESIQREHWNSKLRFRSPYSIFLLGLVAFQHKKSSSENRINYASWTNFSENAWLLLDVKDEYLVRGQRNILENA